MKSWYAVQTRSNYESKVHDSFQRSGVSCLYPTFEKRSRWSDRRKTIFRPLFPGYLFCEISLAQKAAVIAVNGVYQILGGKDPIAIPEFEIRQVQLLMASPQLLTPVLGYQPRCGDQVEVVYGVFSGVTGSVERWKDRHSRIQVTVRIASLMAAARVEVDADCLRKVKAV